MTNLAYPHARNLRTGRFSEAGRIYAVTAVCRNRYPVFADFAAARALINLLRSSEELGHARTLCFVVMPDHLHWLLEQGASRTLSETVRSIKALSSQRYGVTIWQKGFHDHALRADEDVMGLARYIIANPVRAGLVTHVGDYPHWDAVWM